MMPFQIPKVPRLWAIAGGVAVGLMVFGFLGVRYGPGLIAPHLEPASAPGDSQPSAAMQAGQSPAPAAPLDTSGMVIHYGPFVVRGMAYRIEVLRDTGLSKPREAARRVQVFDSTGRIVYHENLFLRGDSTSSENWMEFYPSVLEDDVGVARGFEFGYGWFPSAPNSGVAFSLVAPRGDSLVVLTQTVIGYYGNEASLPTGSMPRSFRLLPGNQKVIESGRGWFDAMIPLRVNFDCAPRGGECVRIDLRDSIAGLARFAVRVNGRQKVDTAVSIEVFGAPRAVTAERIMIPAGQEPEILGGAGRVFFERTPGLFLSGEQEWLEIRLNGRRVWVTGQESFLALGLQQAG